jgi:F-type H+-transporting ATPase subunit b
MVELKRFLAPVLLAAALALTGPVALSAQDASTAAGSETAGAAEGEHAEGAEGEQAAAGETEAGHNVVIPFVSLYNTNFVVIISFLAFVAVLLYLKVPGRLGGMLDSRAVTIRKELDEARKLREEAQALVASYERKQKDMKEQAERIVGTARAEAAAAADKARADLKLAVARRLAAAEDQIASAQAAAVREVRNRAAEIAVQVAAEMLAKGMDASRANALIDEAIETVQTKLH